jgi:hypothetical protein
MCLVGGNEEVDMARRLKTMKMPRPDFLSNLLASNKLLRITQCTTCNTYTVGIRRHFGASHFSRDMVRLLIRVCHEFSLCTLRQIWAFSSVSTSLHKSSSITRRTPESLDAAI